MSKRAAKEMASVVRPAVGRASRAGAISRKLAALTAADFLRCIGALSAALASVQVLTIAASLMHLHIGQALAGGILVCSVVAGWLAWRWLGRERPSATPSPRR